MFRHIKRYFSRYKHLSGNVFALSVVSFLNDTSSEIIYPLLPAFLALTLGATPFAIGLIEGFAESVAAFLKLFSGYLSDKFNRRKLPVFLGYSLASLTRPLLAFVTTWQQVLFVRVTDRVGKGIRGAPRDALLASSVPPEKRGLAFGFNRAADHLGAVFGPVIAFVLLYFLASNPDEPIARDYRQVFLFASIPVALGLFVIVFFVKEKQIDHKEEIEKPKIKLSLKEFDGNFKRFLLVIALFTLSNSTDAFLLLRAEQAGIGVAFLPILWMALHFSKVVFSLIGGDLSDRIGRKKMILAGWIVYALVYAGFAFVDSPWQAWALFIIYGAYFGLTEGVEKALVADLVEPEKRGTAYGFYNLAYSITVFPASLLFGFLWGGLGTNIASFVCTKFDSIGLPIWFLYDVLSNGLGATYAFLISATISIIAAVFLLTIKTENKTRRLE